MDAEEEETPPAPPLRFSTRSLLWATALLSAGMGTFGPVVGVILSVLVTVGHIGAHRRDTISISRLIAAGCFAALLYLGYHALWWNQNLKAQAYSMNNLQTLALAMHNFELANGRLPPPFSVGDKGQPLHSWRTLLLPYLGAAGAYNKLLLDEPWDSPSNRKVFDAAGDGALVFRSPRGAAFAAPTGETHYFAVVDNETIWSPSQVVRFQDNLDGTSNTIALVEVAGRGVRWGEPRDLTMEEAIDVLVGDVDEGYIDPGFFVSTRMRGDGLPNRFVAFVDGSVRTTDLLVNREDARALLTKAGRESNGAGPPFSGSIVNSMQTRSVDSVTVGYIVHWGRVFGLTLFVILALAPLLMRRAGENVAMDEDVATSS